MYDRDRMNRCSRDSVHDALKELLLGAVAILWSPSSRAHAVYQTGVLLLPWSEVFFLASPSRKERGDMTNRLPLSSSC
jgi:hypothetical protein